MIAGLFSDLLSVGGVQMAGRHTAAVLASLARERGWPFRFLSLNDPAGDHALSVGHQGFTFHGLGRSKLLFLLAALRLARDKPHIVLAAHPHLAVPAAAMKTVWPRLRTVVLAHGVEVWTPLPLLRRRSLQRADRVFAPSRDTARKLVAVQGVREEKIRHIAWGLDPDFATLCKDPGANLAPAGFPGGRVILTVGRWAANERYKGLDDLIQAIPALLPSLPDLRLVAVGDGNDRARLEGLAAELGVAGRVHFLSNASREELAACYARSDVFALPSGGEGFGMVFLEAMAFGKPVVGGERGGTPDIVEDGVTGFLVPPGDVERLTRALEALLVDNTLRQQMGAKGRERIRSKYLFEHFESRLADAIRGECKR